MRFLGTLALADVSIKMGKWLLLVILSGRTFHDIAKFVEFMKDRSIAECVSLRVKVGLPSFKQKILYSFMWVVIIWPFASVIELPQLTAFALTSQVIRVTPLSLDAVSKMALLIVLKASL